MIEIQIVICCIDMKSKSYKFLLDNGTIPSAILDDSINNTMKKIVNHYLYINFDWLKFKILKAENTDENDWNKIKLTYGIMIPEIIEIKQGKWADAYEIKDLDSQSVQEVIQESLFRL